MASKRVPHLRQRYCSVIACVPKSEMTTASLALQCGQVGSDRGLIRGGGRRVFPLLEPTEHGKRVLIDRPFSSSPADGVPDVPVNRHVGGGDLQALLHARSHLRRTHGKAALAMEAIRLAVGWTE